MILTLTKIKTTPLMVFHLKDAFKLKRLLPIVLVILMLSLCLVQFPLVNAQEGTATFTGTIFDEGLDTDNDGLFNYLRLGVEVNVTVAGNYTVSIGGLFNSSFGYVSIPVENTTTLDTGVSVVYLKMDGITIYAYELNPFAAAGINIYDENHTQLASLPDLQFSEEYLYTDFQSSTPKIASLTGIITDEGLDTDDDGYFNYLRLEVEVNVTVPGTYDISVAGIHDTTYSSMAIFVKNTMYLDAGVHVVYLYMDGTSIYVTELNPNGIIGVNVYDANGTQIDALNDALLSKTYLHTEFQPALIRLEFDDVKREISLDQVGSVYVTTSYRITNLAYQVSTVEIGLPDGAYDVVIRDEMGELESTISNNILSATLRNTLNTSYTETLYMAYNLPWEKCVNQQDGINYNLNFTLCEGINSTIVDLHVSVILPKGAEFKSSTQTPDSTKKSGIQETLFYTLSNLNSSDNLSFEVDYKQLLFWDSFYPTIWVGIVVIAVSVLSFFWKAPKVSTSAVIQVSSKDLKSFVDSYEEKMRARSDLESLETLVQKGKIPRRRYKVRKRMLEGRLSAANKNLSSLNETIRSAGSHYAEMIKQLDVAEKTLEGAERDLQRVESRYRRGEVSKGAYGKLVDEYKNRIEEAESTIDGVLLRLHE